jgi:hypothetical protein
MQGERGDEAGLTEPYFALRACRAASRSRSVS